MPVHGVLDAEYGSRAMVMSTCVVLLLSAMHHGVIRNFLSTDWAMVVLGMCR